MNNTLIGDWEFDPLCGDWVCDICGEHSENYLEVCPHCNTIMNCDGSLKYHTGGWKE